MKKPNLIKFIFSGTEEEILLKLVEKGKELTAGELSAAFKNEKRNSIFITLKHFYKNIVLPEDQRKSISLADINIQLKRSEVRTRRNFVRRVFKSNKLFALQEILLRYPDYTEELLLTDLKKSDSIKIKKKKKKPLVDLRRCQLIKLADLLERGGLDEKEYHKLCCRIVMLQNAHNHKKPIPLSVNLNGEVKVYSFGWKTRECIVKSFVGLANKKDITHEELDKKHEEMINSNYSY